MKEINIKQEDLINIKELFDRLGLKRINKIKTELNLDPKYLLEVFKILKINKTCRKCKANKLLSEFSIVIDKNNRIEIRNCLNCIKENSKKYREKNKDQIKEQKKDYCEKNKDQIKKQKKDYCEKNKEKSKENYEKNKDQIKKQKKEHYENNKDQIKENSKKYYKNNKEEINKKSNEYKKNKRANNPNFKLRMNISQSIREALKSNNSSKFGASCLNHLDYTIEGLKNHIESLFESWMTWENHGPYKLDSWNDNDSTTWKWNLDHINPHCNFKYTTMEDQDFKDCWALENLRPLSAKQNICEQNNRTIEEIDKIKQKINSNYNLQ